MRKLKFILNFFVGYFLFWIFYFLIARIIFLLFYLENTKEIGLLESIKSLFYGLRLDASFTGYITIIPLFLVLLKAFTTKQFLGAILNLYTKIVLAIVTFMFLLDVGLYSAWGFRIDASILPYLNKPELMIATASNTQIVGGIASFLFLSFFYFTLNKKINLKRFKRIETRSISHALFSLFLIGFLIIPIRGGLQLYPVNQSNVYFSNNMFANHAAINYAWNFFNTFKRKTDKVNPYKTLDTITEKKLLTTNRNSLLQRNIDSILVVDKPNIILIIWESLPAKIVGVLGGEKNVTPNLNRFAKEGLLFTNFYSNGDRTDKAIPAILSGYYPPPYERIMRNPGKTRSLPMLTKEMHKIGYTTSFYYGGDLNFGNMNTYLRNAEIQDIHDGDEFDSKDWNSKWGVYDDVFMNRFAEDLKQKNKTPFFKIALTLSSHEPFEVKGKYKFGTDSEENLFKSSHFYTDKVIGDFVTFAKQQDWYKNTLIVIMSDHGHSLPKHEGPFFAPKKFHIPMVWLGGAVNPNLKEIDTFSSQVDFSFTLLDLLGGNNDDFKFGKNIFNSSAKQYAHYIFSKGFGTLTKNGTFIYDYVGKKPIMALGLNTKELDSLGKAITQNAFQDFIDR